MTQQQAAPLNGVLTDEQIEQMRQRNQVRLQAAQEGLGSKWLVAQPLPRERMQPLPPLLNNNQRLIP